MSATKPPTPNESAILNAAARIEASVAAFRESQEGLRQRVTELERQARSPEAHEIEDLSQELGSLDRAVSEFERIAGELRGTVTGGATVKPPETPGGETPALNQTQATSGLAASGLGEQPQGQTSPITQQPLGTPETGPGGQPTTPPGGPLKTTKEGGPPPQGQPASGDANVDAAFAGGGQEAQVQDPGQGGGSGGAEKGGRGQS